PEDASAVTLVNLTLPISTSKELSIAVKALREHYYFHAIPQSWIQIEKKEKQLEIGSTLPKLPSTLEQLQLALEQKQITNIHIPIRKHHNIQLVMETLRQNFAY